MRFLVDNALSPSVAAGLQRAGHDTVHVRDLNMEASRDEEIFTYAARENRVLLTADTDFGALLASTGMATPSLILFRRTNKKPSDLLNVLLGNLGQLKEALDAGAIVVIEDRRIRIRALPI